MTNKYNSHNRDNHNYCEREIAKIIGATDLERLHAENCEPTGRLLPDCDDRTEWSASIECEGPDGDNILVTAIYYTTPYETTNDDEDNSDRDWEIDHYDITTR